MLGGLAAATTTLLSHNVRRAAAAAASASECRVVVAEWATPEGVTGPTRPLGRRRCA